MIQREPRLVVIKDLPGFEISYDGKPIDVFNISTTGFAAKDFNPLEKTMANFKILIGKDAFDVLALKTRNTPELIAYRFESPPPIFLAAFHKFFKIEKRAKTLSPLNPELVAEKKTREDVFWYRSGSGDELLFTQEGVELVSVQATVLNNNLEFRQETGTRFSKLEKDESRSYAPWVQASATPNDIKDLFRRFFENIDHLKPESKKLLLALL